MSIRNILIKREVAILFEIKIKIDFRETFELIALIANICTIIAFLNL